LRRLCEEHREALGRGAQAYQFTTHASLSGNETTIRIVRLGNEVILSVDATLWIPKVVKRNWTKQLTTADWQDLQAAIRKANFWRLAEWRGLPMLDGVWWTIEGLNGGSYHSAGGSLPDDGPILEIGEVFSRLAATSEEQ